jgi:hypothetical protein
MLGYTEQDIGNMQLAIENASTVTNDTTMNYWLDQAADFLAGLWAEGYFD